MDLEAAKNNNVTWFNGYVTRKDREKVHGHKGAVIWFTGLSASGKMAKFSETTASVPRFRSPFLTTN